MAIKKFEDIIAWQKAMDLITKIFSYFGKSKNFAFRDQIMSASLSISSNIAEGFDRETDKEFRRFLYIAKGSCAEVKSLLYVAIRLKYIEQSHGKILISQCEEISKIIRGLIKSLKIQEKFNFPPTQLRRVSPTILSWAGVTSTFESPRT